MLRTDSPPPPAPTFRGRRPPPPQPADDWALFLDVDGCLLEFAPRPDEVQVPETLLARLDALHARLDGALALISGRSIATLDALFAPARFASAGLHGVERRNAGEDATAAHVPPTLARIRDDARRLAALYDGALVEDKGAALALHWRGATAAAPALQDFAAHVLPQLPGYRLQHGDHVVELRPEHADKGSAIAAFLRAPPFAGRRPVFAGDDLTDEAGFAVINARDGISVLVGDRDESAARYWLRDPRAVRAWLGAAP